MKLLEYLGRSGVLPSSETLSARARIIVSIPDQV